MSGPGPIGYLRRCMQEGYFCAATIGKGETVGPRMACIAKVLRKPVRLKFHLGLRMRLPLPREGPRARSRYTSCGNPHFGPVFLMVVNKRDSLIELQKAIDRHARLAFPIVYLQDGDMVDSLPVPVVDFERIPIIRQAWREAQFVHFEPQPQE